MAAHYVFQSQRGRATFASKNIWRLAWRSLPVLRQRLVNDRQHRYRRGRFQRLRFPHVPLPHAPVNVDFIANNVRPLQAFYLRYSQARETSHNDSRANWACGQGIKHCPYFVERISVCLSLGQSAGNLGFTCRVLRYQPEPNSFAEYATQEIADVSVCRVRTFLTGGHCPQQRINRWHLIGAQMLLSNMRRNQRPSHLVTCIGGRFQFRLHVRQIRVFHEAGQRLHTGRPPARVHRLKHPGSF